MRPAAILQEAWRNVLSGTARTGTLAALAAAVLLTLVVVDVGATRGLVDAAARFRAAGAATYSIAAAARIDGQSCAALSSADPVQAAGAIRRRGPARLLQLPASPVQLFEVTPGFLELFAAERGAGADDGGGAGTGADAVPGAAMTGVGIPAPLATTLGLRPGDALWIDGQRATVAAVYDYPADGRRPELGWAVLAAVPAAGSFDECWAHAWPAPERARLLLPLAIAPATTASDSVQLAQVNPALGLSFDAEGGASTRLARWAPLGAALAGAALAWGSVRGRRLELACALHLGVRRRDVVVQSLAETLSWAACSPLFAAAAGAFLAGALPRGDGVPLVEQALRSGVALLLGALCGTALAVNLVRESALFRYFRDRR